MNTLENVKQWFIDRDFKCGGRLDKQSLKLIEEFGELCAGYLKFPSPAEVNWVV